MTASHWLIVALLFVGLELILGAEFVFLWLALAALGVAAVVWAFVLDWPSQLLIFSAALIAAGMLWWRCRKPLLGANNSLNNRTADLVGQTFVLSKAIAQGRGQVMINDTVWQVHGSDQPQGSSVTVLAVDGVVLKVIPAPAPS